MSYRIEFGYVVDGEDDYCDQYYGYDTYEAALSAAKEQVEEEGYDYAIVCEGVPQARVYANRKVKVKKL